MLGHELILGHARARDEGGDRRAGRRRGVRVGSDADNHVRGRVSFGDQERIDPAALADKGDVGVDALADRLQKCEICGAGQVPVLAIPDDEIENVLAWRELNHGGVPDAGGDLDDLIGRVLYLQDGRAGRQVGRGVLRLGQRRDEAQHRDKGHDWADGHTFLSCSLAHAGKVSERPLEAVLLNRLGAARTVARR